jgi:hypothetical protein
MKSINKHNVLRQYTNETNRYNVDTKSYYNSLLFEKEIGLLGNECRFLVKLVNSFQTEV